MHLKFIEAVSDAGNYGKFAVGRFEPDEWNRGSELDREDPRPLLAQCGWGRIQEHIWVLDLQTGEGAYFRPGGYAKADLDKHRIWVCPLFEPFLTWLYTQDTSSLDALNALPSNVALLTGLPLELRGYRRPGPEAAAE